MGNKMISITHMFGDTDTPEKNESSYGMCTFVSICVPNQITY